MINEHVEGWNARGKECHFEDDNGVDVSSRKEHISEQENKSGQNQGEDRQCLVNIPLV